MMRLKAFSKFIFVGFLTGYCIAILAGHWTWLAMRVNPAYMIPLLSLAGLLLITFNGCLRNKLWLLIPEIAFLILLLSFYWQSPEAILVVPGILFREGFGLSFLSLTQANMVLIMVILIGNLIWFFCQNEYCELKGREQDA